MTIQTPKLLHVFDTETTGVNVASDRILTCYSATYHPDLSIEYERSWTIDPGVEVPEAAAKVHGMTTEWVRENGRNDPDIAVCEIFNNLIMTALAGIPIAAYNLRYDMSILHYELLRHGHHDGVMKLLDIGVFYDAIVHEKERNRFVKGAGQRKLEPTCKRYGIEFNADEAHDAEYDVRKTAELSFKLLAKEKKLGVAELMPLLVEWKLEQDNSLEEFFQTSGRKNDDGSEIRIDRGWPLITRIGN